MSKTSMQPAGPGFAWAKLAVEGPWEPVEVFDGPRGELCA